MTFWSDKIYLQHFWSDTIYLQHLILAILCSDVLQPLSMVCNIFNGLTHWFNLGEWEKCQYLQKYDTSKVLLWDIRTTLLNLSAANNVDTRWQGFLWYISRMALVSWIAMPVLPIFLGLPCDKHCYLWIFHI